jgi:hypothetical protein
MIDLQSFKKRKTRFLGVLFVVLFIFTADMLDLREELLNVSCPFGCLDSDVTIGVISGVPFTPELILIMGSGKKEVSVKISFIHFWPYGFRAPPTQS